VITVILVLSVHVPGHVTIGQTIWGRPSKTKTSI